MNKSLRKILILCFSLITLITCFTGAFIANAQGTLSVDNEFFNKAYAVNSKIQLPTATIDGENASVCVISPSGATVNDFKVLLNEEGTYTVIYTAGTKSVEKTITAKFAPSSMFTVSDNVTLTNNQSVPDYISKVVDGMQHKYNTSGLGIFVEDESATIHYNGIVNFDNIVGDGSSSPFMEMIATPSRQGVLEFQSGINFKFTDIHDPENFFTMTVSAKDDENTHVKVFDRYGKEFVPIEWGQYLTSTHSFKALTNRENCINPISVYFYHSRDFTVYLNSYKLNNERITGAAKYSIGDIVAQGKNAINFTTNEAYLDISFGDILDGGASFVLTKLLNTDLNKEFLETDDFEYVIEADNVNNLPYGVRNYPYNIPTAYGYNVVVGLVPAKFYVTDSNGNVYSGNKIVPKTVGAYTINYYCEYNGVKKEFAAKFNVYADYLPSDKLSYNISPVNLTIGQPYMVEKGGVTGGIGNVSVDYKLFIDGVETDFQGQGDNRYLVAYDSTKEYVIKHYVSDDLQTKVYNQQINVIHNADCYFNKTFVPSYVMVNRSYQILTPSAYYLDGAGEYKTISTELMINDKLATEFRFVDAGEYKIKFRALIDNVAHYSQEYTVMAIADDAYVYGVDKNNKEQKSYIYNFLKVDNGTIAIDSTSNNIGIRSNNTNGSLTTAKFNVPISIQNASVSFKTGEISMVNFETINVKIYDLSGESITIKFAKETLGAKDYVAIMHGDTILGRYESKFIDNTFRFNVSKDGNVFDGDYYNATLNNWDSGFVFDGFSDFVWLEFQLANVVGNSTVYLDRIGNQTITKIATDRVGPFLKLNREIPANIYIKLGEEYSFPTAYSFDLLQQYGEVYVSVETLAGVPILMQTKLENEFVFEAEERGEYLVIYTAYEKANRSGNSAKIQTYIKVETDVLPTIILDGEIPLTAKLGSTVSIPQAIVDSPISADIQVYVIDPENSNLKLESGKVKIEKEGMYLIRFIAVDEEGNIAISEYRINENFTPEKASLLWLWITLPAVAVVVGGAVAFVLIRRKKKHEKSN